jgi:hypothetical protein
MRIIKNEKYSQTYLSSEATHLSFPKLHFPLLDYQAPFSAPEIYYININNNIKKKTKKKKRKTL